MVVTADDFVPLPFDEGLSLAGVEHTKRNLMRLRERHGPLRLDTLREHATHTAVELAFRRWLDLRKVPYRVAAAGLSGEPGRGTIFIGGRRTEIETSAAGVRGALKLRGENLLLNSQVSARQHTAMEAGQERTDLLVFAAAQIEVIRSQQESKKRQKEGKRVEMAALLADELLRPKLWRSLGEVMAANGGEHEMALEAAGYNEKRRAMVEEIRVKGKGTGRWAGDFYILGGLFSRELASGEITLRIEQSVSTYKVGQHQWGNIWVYGERMLLLGYLPRGEYRGLVRERPGARRLPGSDHTSPGVRVRELRPMGEMLARAKEWMKHSK